MDNYKDFRICKQTTYKLYVVSGSSVVTIAATIIIAVVIVMMIVITIPSLLL